MTFTNSINGFDGAQELLIKLVEQSPDDWETRKRVVNVLYDAEFHHEAADLAWGAPEIPPVTEEIAFTVRVVSMGRPERAVRLVTTMLKANQDNPQECMNIAKALMGEGLSLQALRFYGVATAKDINLVDTEFEMAVIDADTGDDSWAELVTADDFPWDGPRDMTIEDATTHDAAEGNSAAEVLLNSVTQRVPLKAPIQAQTEAVRSVLPPKSPGSESRPTAPAETVATNEKSNPAPETELSASVGNENDKLISLVKPAEQVKPAPINESPAVVTQLVAAPVPALNNRVTTHVNTAVTAPPTPATAIIEGLKPSSSDGLVARVPEVVLAAPAQSVQAAIAGAAAEKFNTQPVVEESVVEESVTSLETNSVSNTPVVSDETQPSDMGNNEGLSDEPYEDDGDVNDLSSNSLVKRQLYSSKSKSEGVFSSLTGIFKRSKADQNNDEDTALENAVSVTDEASASKQKKGSQDEKAKEAPIGHVQPNSNPVTTTVVPRHEPKGYEPPKELDGRTQLVALAPQDGNIYFEELIEKYNDLPVDELPPAVTVARDMANVDYLGLVQAACVKDLDAFSKLLGLHRVMTEANCPGWVDDMNLLRKGYGDAVLATVVSKYSVSECREILGAVYQRPGEQKVAG